MRRYGPVALGFLLICIPLPAAYADPEECQIAIDHYNEAIGDIGSALRQYAACVSDSRAHEACSVEFSTLQSAQSDFEDAVSDYGDDCD